MFKRRRDIPQEFEDDEDARYAEMTDDQLARVYERSNPAEKRSILKAFRERTGQELK